MKRRNHSPERGATYLFVMLAVVLVGLSASVVAKQWKAVVQREQEAELLARGVEIQNALAAYSGQQKKGRVMPGEIYPLTLEELTKQPKPALRRDYKDPITGGDWEYIRDPATGRIKGVRSKSTAEPFKQTGFPPAVQHFTGLTSYDQWVFQHPNTSTPKTPQAAPTAPGTTPAPPTAPVPPPPVAPAAPPAATEP
jgi:type II secretory pathway pseudopilin PulG